MTTKKSNTSHKKQENFSSKSVKDEPIPPDDLVGQIYRIKNLENGKRYIGQTRNYFINHGKYRSFGYEKRFKDHISEALNNVKKKQCYKLNCAIRKYGKEKFHVKLIRTCPVEKLDEYEIKYIKKYDSYKNGYNLTKGGNGAKMNSGIRKKLSNATKKYYENKENKLKQSTIQWINADTKKYQQLEKRKILRVVITRIKNKDSISKYDVKFKTNTGGYIQYQVGGIHITHDIARQRIVKLIKKLIKNENLEMDNVDTPFDFDKVIIDKKLFVKPKTERKKVERKRSQTYVEKNKQQRIDRFKSKKIDDILLGKKTVKGHTVISADIFYKTKKIGSCTFGGKHDTLEESTSMLDHFLSGLEKIKKIKRCDVLRFSKPCEDFIKTLSKKHSFRAMYNAL